MRRTTIPGSAVLAGAGLFLALVALLAAPRSSDELPAVRLRLEVPDSLLLASGIAFALAALIVLGIGLSRDRRRQEAELLAREEESSKLPWWLQGLVRLLPLLPLIASLLIFSFGWQYVEGSLLAWRSFILGTDSGVPDAELPEVSLPLAGWLLGTLTLLAGLATLAVAVLLLFAERIARWWEGSSEPSEARPLTEAIDESLEDLAAESDARAAIIKCYRRFERVAARARVPREPWQTPDEFMRETLDRLALPRRAVDRLTRLFELARFSLHPLESPERDLARACLEEIRAALARAEEGAPLGVA